MVFIKTRNIEKEHFKSMTKIFEWMKRKNIRESIDETIYSITTYGMLNLILEKIIKNQKKQFELLELGYKKKLFPIFFEEQIKNAKVYGIEKNELNPDKKFIKGDFLELKNLFPGKKFDIIYSRNVFALTQLRELDNKEKKEEFLKAIKEKLKDKGFFIAEFNEAEELINEKELSNAGFKCQTIMNPTTKQKIIIARKN
jgi:hypothetical protein